MISLFPDSSQTSPAPSTRTAPRWSECTICFRGEILEHHEGVDLDTDAIVDSLRNLTPEDTDADEPHGMTDLVVYRGRRIVALVRYHDRATRPMIERPAPVPGPAPAPQ